MTKQNREIIHPKPKVGLHVGDKSLTETTAKKLLGWAELDSKDKREHLLKDTEGNRIVCVNNVNNRELQVAWCRKLSQDILRGNWRFNFENIIIGETGLILSGQHRLIALVLACQTYRKNPEIYNQWWESDPTIETSIGYGAAEDELTINTLDTGKPRSLYDVLFRSEYFRDKGKREKQKLAKSLDHAVRLLWARTGVPGAFSIERTHSESVSFIERHRRLLECVSHINLEDTDSTIRRYIGPGYATALMYLMATSETDPKNYQDQNEPDETTLNFDLFDKAEKFWTLLSSGKEFEILRKALDKVLNSEEEIGTSLNDIKQAIIIKAWIAFESSGKVTRKSVALKFKETDGFKHLDESPCVGGIDFLGNRDDQVIEETKKPEKSKPKGRARKVRGSDIVVGAHVEVHEPDGEPWEGTISSVDPLKVTAAEGYAGEGRDFEVGLNYLKVRS